MKLTSGEQRSHSLCKGHVCIECAHLVAEGTDRACLEPALDAIDMHPPKEHMRYTLSKQQKIIVGKIPAKTEVIAI